MAAEREGPRGGTAEGAPSARTRLRRRPERARYARDEICAILDEGLVCHVGFVGRGGPTVIPTTYARAGDVLYLHGSPASHLLRSLRDGLEACVTVTLLDGIVLARSAFHHSMNYRSVLVFGRAREVTDPGEKAAALRALVEHVAPGRSDESRPPSARELGSTLVLALPLDEASAKVRSGPPRDDEADLGLGHWAGVVPIALAAGAPEPAPDLTGDVPVPDSAARYRRPRR